MLKLDKEVKDGGLMMTMMMMTMILAPRTPRILDAKLEPCYFTPILDTGLAPAGARSVNNSLLK